VAKVYNHKSGIDYFDVFVPVARFDMIIFISNGFEYIYQMDVKSNFFEWYFGKIKTTRKKLFRDQFLATK